MRWLPLLFLLLAIRPCAAGPCQDSADRAEAGSGIPAGLLAAIGRVESGRRGGDGSVEAWPWSVNAAGQGYFLESAAAAVALVTSLQAKGIRSIDVGCFQVNLLHHPGAFATLADAFDPVRNAHAAADFLRDLRQGAAGWPDAVARYHSANPWLGQPYMRQVLASWTGGPATRQPARSRVAALVRVIVPGGAAVAAFGGLRLPVVITPGRASS